MTRFWTESRLDDAVAELESTEFRPGAIKAVCERLSRRWGTRVTDSALLHAFKDFRESRPSDYLGRQLGIRDTEPVQAAQDFHVHEPQTEEIDVHSLVERRKQQFERKKKVEEENALIYIDVKLDGPIGIVHFGDPHVDDDGTDISALERHTDIVRNTEGMFGGNVGDTTNNWVGRLARLYAQQSTSAAEGIALAEWFVNRCRWLYMVAGNHDMWSGAGDPLKWITKQAGAFYKETNVRLALRFPNGRCVRVNVRHDFSGHSQWNPAHGSMKAAQFGAKDHVLVNGHKHISGYGVIRDPDSEIVSHCIQVASYKRYDRYAKDKGFRDQTISPCAVTIIDPEATEASLVQTFWEPEPAAEFLTWKRRRRAA